MRFRAGSGETWRAPTGRCGAACLATRGGAAKHGAGPRAARQGVRGANTATARDISTRRVDAEQHSSTKLGHKLRPWGTRRRMVCLRAAALPPRPLPRFPLPLSPPRSRLSDGANVCRIRVLVASSVVGGTGVVGDASIASEVPGAGLTSRRRRRLSRGAPVPPPTACWASPKASSPLAAC